MISKNPKRSELVEVFPELRAVTERIFGDVWKDEDDELWESYLVEIEPAIQVGYTLPPIS